MSASSFGIAERIVPRVSFYIKEQGYGEEFILNQAKLFLDSIKAWQSHHLQIITIAANGDSLRYCDIILSYPYFLYDC